MNLMQTYGKVLALRENLIRTGVAVDTRLLARDIGDIASDLEVAIHELAEEAEKRDAEVSPAPPSILASPFSRREEVWLQSVTAALKGGKAFPAAEASNILSAFDERFEKKEA